MIKAVFLFVVLSAPAAFAEFKNFNKKPPLFQNPAFTERKGFPYSLELGGEHYLRPGPPARGFAGIPGYFKSFSDLKSLTLENKRLIQAVQKSQLCDKVKGRILIVKFLNGREQSRYVIPVDIKFKGWGAGYRQFEFSFIEAKRRLLPGRGFKQQWRFDYGAKEIKENIFISNFQVFGFNRKEVRLKPGYKFNLDNLVLYKSIPTKNGDTSKSCELKKVVSKISF